MVVPHRNLLFMAKSIAPTDQLSGGRVTVGCGAGWMREEFEALNIEDFDARERVTDEYIAVMQALWQEPRASFHGELIDFADVAADPKPVQRPRPKFRINTISTFVARRDRLFAEADKVGCGPESIELAYNCAFHDEIAQDDGCRLSWSPIVPSSPHCRAGRANRRPVPARHALGSALPSARLLQ